MINADGLRLMELSTADRPRMRELMWKDRDLPMDVADAAPRPGCRRIFNVDRRDFEPYQPYRLGRLRFYRKVSRPVCRRGAGLDPRIDGAICDSRPSDGRSRVYEHPF